MPRFRQFVVGLAVSVLPASAMAHADLDFPAMRGANQKSGPCEGAVAGTPSIFRPGQTVVVRFKETIPHPGHFRLLFDSNGGEDFPDPTNCDDVNNVGTDLGNGVTVLGDGILKAPGNMCQDFHTPAERTPAQATYTYEVTMPNVECESCVLQLIQVMTDKAPWGAGGGNDIYYRCADVKLSSNPNDAVTVDDGAVDAPDAGPGNDNNNNGNANGNDNGNENGNGGSDGGGCSVSGASESASAMFLFVLALLWIRKRRSLLCRS